MPANNSVDNPLVDLSVGRASTDEAQVGYYKSSLANGVTVELAGTAHAGFYQYTFPKEQPNAVVVDVSHVLPSFRGLGWGQDYHGGNFTIAEDGHYEGSGIYDKGWNLSPEWTIYFCGKFNQSPSNARVFSGNGTTLDRYDSKQPLSVSSTERVGGVFNFNSSSVSSRVGVSWISSAKACEYLDQEIPAETTLDDLITAAQNQWTSKVFSKVTTTDTNTTKLDLLYTSLYGMHLIPSNRTGDNPHWSSSEPYYDDIFTFWDLFRCSTALMHILQPVAYEEQIRSLIDIWRHDGFLPDARSSNYNGRTQGGSNADNVLADAYVKGVRGAVNWEDGYSAMVTDAETVPPNNNDPSAPDSSTKEGRGALPDWLKYGYITPNFTRAVSRAVEYSANDFGLHQVASGLGKAADAEKYLNRSRNWRNHWNPAASSNNHSGFVVPRNANGSFVAQDPLSCGGCYWGDAYYEALPWEYSMNAHHDMDTLIAYVGGADKFVDRIEKMFQGGLYGGNSAFNSTIFNPGNEPSFTTPYLYNYVGRQDLSVQRSRHVAKTYYNAGASGLPGNSDAGAMQTWLLWNMLGLYPMTGQPVFLVGSPWFSQLSIALGGGKTLHIAAMGGSSDDDDDNDDVFFVQSLRVNGAVWDRAWVAWSDVFANGGTLEFELGAEPRIWATGDAPPSPASGDGSVTAPAAAGAGKQNSGLASRSSDQANARRSRTYLSAAIICPCVVGLGLAWWARARPLRKRRGDGVMGRNMENMENGAPSAVEKRRSSD